MKIRLVETDLFHAEGQKERQTDMTTVIIALRNFANALKMCSVRDTARTLLQPNRTQPATYSKPRAKRPTW